MPEGLEFEPLQEKWGHYLLENGMLVRARVFVKDVRSPKTPGEAMGIQTQVVVSSSGPDNLKKEPSPPEVIALKKWKILKELSVVDTRKEAVSVYLMGTGEIIAIHLRPVSFQLADAFNSEGFPVIVVNTLNAIQGLPAVREEDWKEVEKERQAAEPEK